MQAMRNDAAPVGRHVVVSEEKVMELAVTITRVCYPPATSEGKWYILQTDQGTAKGEMSWRPRDNEALVLSGEWAVYQGRREFVFWVARLNVPTNPRDQLHYVVERTTGMGSAMEEAIWAAAGSDWQSITPGSVPRLGGALYEKFRLQIEALAQNAAQAAVVAALMGRGATPAMAQAAWEKWKAETLGVVNADPFRLAELDGYGFGHVDRGIRQSYGIMDDDGRRVKAAVVHALRRLTDGGSTVVAWADLFASACAMLGGLDDLVFEAAKELLQAGTLKGFPEAGCVALAGDYRAECDVWEYVTAGKV
jgi:exodeoxyribonuclease V alpha subunit